MGISRELGGSVKPEAFEQILLCCASENSTHGPGNRKLGLESYFCLSWCSFRAEHSERPPPQESRSQRQGLDQAEEDLSSKIHKGGWEGIGTKYGFCWAPLCLTSALGL